MAADNRFCRSAWTPAGMGVSFIIRSFARAHTPVGSAGSRQPQGTAERSGDEDAQRLGNPRMMLRYPIRLEPDEDTVLATCPLLPEVTTFGENEADARRHARDAVEEALAARIS